MKVIGLLVVLFVGAALCHSDHADGFDFDENPIFQRIVAKHYQKYMASLPLEKRNSIREDRDVKDLSYNCVHDKILEKQKELKAPRADSELSPVEERSTGKRAVGPIRFRLEEDLITSNTDPRACHAVGQTVIDPTDGAQVRCAAKDLLDADLRALFLSLSDGITEFFSEALSIEQVAGNLRLNRDTWNDFGRVCFPGIPIPQSYIDVGVAGADMIVYFSARPVASYGTVAYALTCNYQQLANERRGRPLAGHVNYVPEQFQTYKGAISQFKYASALKVGIHEFTHALGFSSQYYKSFFDKKTGNFYASTTYVDCVDEFAIARITTPRVVEVARAHYGCNSLIGVQLEEFGGAGTSGSHWDRRVVGDEYMAGFINPVMPVSYLTLALFEDMGFYTPNYTVSEYWGWGKGQGCQWAEQRCEVGWAGKDGYFCDDAATTGCSADRKGKGSCNIVTYSFALNPYYQHFSNPRLGGDDAAADFCTYLDIRDTDDYCTNEASTNAFGSEVYGSQSRCWYYTVSGQTTGTACWNHKCNGTNLVLTISGVDYACPPEGGVIPGIGPTSNGVLCPPSSLLCSFPLPPVGNLTTLSSVTQPRKECSSGTASCFIATAAYGSPSESHVWALRHFRDNYLIQTSVGREFVSWYYRVSPPIADWISRSEVARLVVRCLLAPLVAIVRLF